MNNKVVSTLFMAVSCAIFSKSVQYLHFKKEEKDEVEEYVKLLEKNLKLTYSSDPLSKEVIEYERKRNSFK